MGKMIPWPIEDMKRWYEKEEMSLQEIADRLSSDDFQVYWKRELGREYRPHQKIVNKVAKRTGFAMRGRGAPGSRNGFWNGGRTVDKNGYILVKSPNHPFANSAGYVREHRLVAEKCLGRYLTETEVVHHRDEDTGNNDPDNLMVYETNAIHVSETTKGKARKTKPMIDAIKAKRAAWWQERIHTIRDWNIDDNLTLKQIQSLVGMSHRTLSSQLKKHGYKPVFYRRLRREPADYHRRIANEWAATPYPDRERHDGRSQRRKARLKASSGKDAIHLSQTAGYMDVIASLRRGQG